MSGAISVSPLQNFTKIVKIWKIMILVFLLYIKLNNISEYREVRNDFLL